MGMIPPQVKQNQRAQSFPIEDTSGMQNMESSKKGKSSQDYSQGYVLKKLYGDELIEQGIVSPQDQRNITSEISQCDDNLAQMNEAGKQLNIDDMTEYQGNKLVSGPQLSFNT